MKLRPFARYSQDDYGGAPSWFTNFLGNLNMLVDTLNPLLQGGVDIDNNLAAERQTVTVTHNVAISLRMRRIGQPRSVRIGYAAGYVGVPGIVGYSADGTVQVIVTFVGTLPTAAVAIELIFEP